jgi:hypothetical protein
MVLNLHHSLIKKARCKMAASKTNQGHHPQKADQLPLDAPLMDEPLPTPNDPGGAHAKGYSADPRPGQEVVRDEPIPLASVPADGSHVLQPERAGKVQPTGRSEPHDYTPNYRLMGSDR